MNVLSLFDGMSCGQIALNRAGIKYNNYYASEIDKHAIKVTQANYPNTIQMGSVTEWKTWDVDWSSIDLFFGGSPCQGFSFAGKQLAFDDPRSKLFFIYVDILEHIKKHNPKVKFMLENVLMGKDSENIISKFLGLRPFLINSKDVSAQYRNRLYWANWTIVSPNQKNILFSDVMTKINNNFILSKEYQERFKDSKVRSLRRNLPTGGAMKIIGTTVNQLAEGTNSRHWVHSVKSKIGCLSATDYKQPKQFLYNGKVFKMNPVEYERLQTVPDNYTNHVSNTQRYKMLGNGWTVDVIAHIFKTININKKRFTDCVLDQQEFNFMRES